MPSIINTNIPSLNAQRNLNSSQGALAVALQRLSSGMRVNSAKDDAAGLAIATRMSAQGRGMAVAVRNANDGISLSQTAESALGQIKDHLLRMRDLAVQAANATNTSGDQSQLQNEFSQLQAEVSRIYQQTTFNGLKILDADAGTLAFQVGANSGETIDIVTRAVSGTAISAAIDSAASIISGSVATAGAASASVAIDLIDKALDSLNTERSTYGAAQSRFEGVISILQVSRENQEAAASRILDADYAAETAALTRAQILQQAGTAMLAQANAIPNNVLSLLKG
jgi:flagellin